MIRFDSGMLLVSNEERLLLYNDSAARIWSGLAAGAEPDEIVALLSRVDGADPDSVRRDVASLIAGWRAGNVLPGASAAPVRRERAPLPERSGSPDSWVCRIRGRRIGFEADHPASARTVRLLLDPLADEGGPAEALIGLRDAGGGEVAVLLDGKERARVRNGIGLRDTVHAALFELVWPDRPISALIHGGAVARDGAGICLAGSAGSGKTTLTAHLAQSGYDYLADDMVPVDGHGSILPWPVPLSVKEGSWALLERLHPGLEWGRSFEGAKGPARLLMPAAEAWDRGPVPLNALVFPIYDENARGEIDPLEPLEALSRLFAAGLWLGHPLTEARVESFLDWFGQVPAFALAYARLEEAERLVSSLFDELPAPRTAGE